MVWSMALKAPSPVTLTDYTCRGQTDLVRGEDFIVHQTSPSAAN
jgi:hypothetical protein